MIKNNLTDFIEYLLSEYKSKNTIQAYKKDAQQFLEYFKDKDISLFTKDDIEIYKDYLLNIRKLNINSINRKLVSIHEYLLFCDKPILIRQIKTQLQNFLEDVLSSSDITKILKETEIHKDYRAFALISTMKFTGMRVSETLQITINDIDKDTINIVGKGSKRRNVFIPNKLHNIWQVYLPYRIKKSDYLFTGKRGRLTRSTAYRIIRKYGEMANINKEKCHPHSLRHAYCLSLASKKLRIEDISALVGHESLETTKLYLRKTKQELLDIINDI